MIAGFHTLTEAEKQEFLAAPAIVSVLAAVSGDGEVQEHEKAEAERIARYKPDAEIPALAAYYEEVRKRFSADFENIVRSLPAGSREEKKAYLVSRLDAVKKILEKLPAAHAQKLLESYNDFGAHVFQSNSSVLKDFLIPIGLNKPPDYTV